jgi:hypothetical protein
VVGAAEEEARRSVRRRPGSVPCLVGTPQGQAGDGAPFETLGFAPPHVLELPTVRAVTAEVPLRGADGVPKVFVQDSGGSDEGLAAPSPPPPQQYPPQPSPPPSPQPPAGGAGNVDAGNVDAGNVDAGNVGAGNVDGLLAAANAHSVASAAPAGSSSRDRQPAGASPARDRANKAAKAAAAARAHYLRTAVDPVFVPLLDAVVFHKPRDVAAFVAERTLRQVRTHRSLCNIIVHTPSSSCVDALACMLSAPCCSHK